MVTNDHCQEFHLVTVNDGEKIPDKYREAIFKPFVQVERKNDHKMAGSGIGLALSKSLAELHKGDLVLETGELDEWIRFNLTLPTGETDEVMKEFVKEPKKKNNSLKQQPLLHYC